MKGMIKPDGNSGGALGVKTPPLHRLRCHRSKILEYLRPSAFYNAKFVSSRRHKILCISIIIYFVNITTDGSYFLEVSKPLQQNNEVAIPTCQVKTHGQRLSTLAPTSDKWLFLIELYRIFAQFDYYVIGQQLHNATCLYHRYHCRLEGKGD